MNTAQKIKQELNGEMTVSLKYPAFANGANA